MTQSSLIQAAGQVLQKQRQRLLLQGLQAFLAYWRHSIALRKVIPWATLLLFCFSLLTSKISSTERNSSSNNTNFADLQVEKMSAQAVLRRSLGRWKHVIYARKLLRSDLKEEAFWAWRIVHEGRSAARASCAALAHSKELLRADKMFQAWRRESQRNCYLQRAVTFLLLVPHHCPSWYISRRQCTRNGRHFSRASDVANDLGSQNLQVQTCDAEQFGAAWRLHHQEQWRHCHEVLFQIMGPQGGVYSPTQSPAACSIQNPRDILQSFQACFIPVHDASWQQCLHMSMRIRQYLLGLT